MPPATASGADAANGGDRARNREHNQGNQERKHTPEQAAAVLRIRRCQATAFYEILDIQKSATDGEVKKAYRKQSLLTHPDKNGHEHADEAFKMVARAFSILGDKDKRSRYDRYGTDPDSRFGGGGPSPGGAGAGMRNPFAGGAGGGGMGGGGGGMWEEEISPEEIFRRFFGGGGFGGGGGGFGPFGGGFDTGPQFVFNMGGGPGFRVHQFGGARPRARPRAQQQGQAGQQQDSNLVSTLLGLLPILLVFVLPLLSSLFSGDGLASQPKMPGMVFDAPTPPYTHGRKAAGTGVRYFVNPQELGRFGDTPQKLSQLDNYADVVLARTLRAQCEREGQHKERLRYEAQGWIFQDAEKMEMYHNYETKACDRLRKLNLAVS